MAPTSELNAFLAGTRFAVEGVIGRWAALVREEDPIVGPAIAYALESPGKRLRPALLMAAYRELKGRGPAEELAASVEVVHCYSLVHDDLPCMDDDDFRRGQPTCHRVFGEGMAVLAGDALLTLAFEWLARPLPGVAPERQLRAIAAVAGAAGPAGMVGGQAEDLRAGGDGAATAALRGGLSAAALKGIYRKKTAALFRAAVLSGGILAGAGDAEAEALEAYAEAYGLAFQIADDLEDGGPYPRLVGEAAARREAAAALEEAEAAVAGLPGGGRLLAALAGLVREKVAGR